MGSLTLQMRRPWVVNSSIQEPWTSETSRSSLASGVSPLTCPTELGWLWVQSAGLPIDGHYRGKLKRCSEASASCECGADGD